MTDQIQYNPDCICRICLSESDQMIGIFNGQSNENIPNILMFFASIKISNGDGLPNQICSLCMYEANNAYYFKQKCEESDKFLRDTLQQHQQQLHEQHYQQQNVLYISHNETTEDSTNKRSDSAEDVFCDFFNNDESNTTTEINATDPFKSLSSSICLLIDHNTVDLPVSLPQSVIDDELPSTSQFQLQDQHGQADNYNYFIESKAVTVGTTEKPKKRNDKLSKKIKLKSNIISTVGLGINKLHCNECEELFDKKIDLRRHLAVDHVFVDGERNFECIECKKLYTTDAILNIHMKTHNNKEYPCENCTKIFYRLDKLVEHKKRHSGERDHICPKCGKGFYDKYYLDRHMHIHERDHLERPIYECTVCGKKMAHSNHLQVHMRAHLDRICPPVNNSIITTTGDGGGGNGDNDCLGGSGINDDSSLLPPSSTQTVSMLDNTLTSLTSSASSLSPSIGILKQKKIILCSVCGKSCSSRSNLAVHMRRHTGKMTNFCKICGKGYPRTTDLTVHMRKHTGEKPFHCQICSRNFARSDKLAVHMRTHTGEKPYACNCCGRAFAQSNDLASHKRRNVCQSSLQPPPQQSQFSDYQLPTTPSTEINNVKTMYFIGRKADNIDTQIKDK